MESFTVADRASSENEANGKFSHFHDFLMLQLSLVNIYMRLQPFLSEFALVVNGPRYPVARHDALVCFVVVLRLNEFRSYSLELIVLHLQRTKAGVHFVCGEAQDGIEDERCGEIIVL